MSPERWNQILERSDSLRLSRRDEEATDALRTYLHQEAECGRAPIGWVSDPRYLLPPS